MNELTFNRPLAISCIRMKKWFSLLLLAGALFGLLGQEAAFAQTIQGNMADRSATAAPMTPECAAMMELATHPKLPEMPCQGMTRDCAAKMSCAVALALVEPIALNSRPVFGAAAPISSPVPQLNGRDIGPEPEPPARLG